MDSHSGHMSGLVDPPSIAMRFPLMAQNVSGDISKRPQALIIFDPCRITWCHVLDRGRNIAQQLALGGYSSGIGGSSEPVGPGDGGLAVLVSCSCIFTSSVVRAAPDLYRSAVAHMCHSTLLEPILGMYSSSGSLPISAPLPRTRLQQQS